MVTKIVYVHKEAHKRYSHVHTHTTYSSTHHPGMLNQESKHNHLQGKGALKLESHFQHHISNNIIIVNLSEIVTDLQIEEGGTQNILLAQKAKHTADLLG